jgi:peptidoglycan/xylan/chitin deacetylase (PgdA/CDA1 family)
MGPLVTLLYHSVDDRPPSWIAPFSVSRKRFDEHLDAVVASGRIPVTAQQVVAAVRGGRPLPERPVLVTFDDGFADFAQNALPALQEHALPATLFVTTGMLAPASATVLPKADMLTLDQVCELDAAGVEIGAHSHTHAHLDTLARTVLSAELAAPKRILETALGHPVTIFAYPHGYSSRLVRSMTSQAGYQGAFAVRDALSSSRDNPYQLARLTVRADTSRDTFKAWLRGEGAPIAPFPERLPTRAWRAYRRARAFVAPARVRAEA